MERFRASDTGSAEAFDELYARYKDRTWRYFRRQLTAEAAEDCQQDLWMKIIERRARYNARDRFGGYLFTVAHSVLIDAQRKSLRVVDAATDHALEPDELQAHANTEPARASGLQRAVQALKAALGRLPAAQRNTFVMQQEAGLSYADIARATDTNLETVKSRLRYARSTLAAELRDQLSEEFDHAEF